MTGQIVASNAMNAPQGTILGEENTMWVLLIYLGLMIGFDVLDYGAGALVENMWGSNASLVFFLAAYFFTLWLSWAIAWRAAEKLRLTT